MPSPPSPRVGADLESEWLTLTLESFRGEGPSQLRALGLEVDEENLLARAPFGPPATVGSRVLVRRGRALYVALAGASGTYRIG